MIIDNTYQQQAPHHAEYHYMYSGPHEHLFICKKLTS